MKICRELNNRKKSHLKDSAVPSLHMGKCKCALHHKPEKTSKTLLEIFFTSVMIYLKDSWKYWINCSDLKKFRNKLRRYSVSKCWQIFDLQPFIFSTTTTLFSHMWSQQFWEQITRRWLRAYAIESMPDFSLWFSPSTFFRTAPCTSIFLCKVRIESNNKMETKYQNLQTLNYFFDPIKFTNWINLDS